MSDHSEAPGKSDSSARNGVIEEIAPSELRLRTVDGSISVTLRGDAEIWRDGPADLADFLIGEEVVAYGEWHDGVFDATRLEPLYRMDDGVVLKTEPDRIVTNNGTVLLTPLTRYRQGEQLDAAPPSKITRGQHIRALGRRKANSPDLLGLRIEIE